jgi:outer membrane protein OmpA-like peptidoglycan-associated protein
MKIFRYLIITFICFTLAGCANKYALNDNGIAVEVFKRERKKPTPQKTVMAESDIFLLPVFFDFDKYALSEDAKDALNKNIAAIKNAERIIITGNCDNRGTENHNKILAQKRADIVKDFYVLRGVNHDKIATSINIKDQKICKDNNDEICHSQNRRTDTLVRYF